ncbi:MAG: hypothetical protein Q9204_007175, partial [Flavoplaca sp. TL-2023a]
EGSARLPARWALAHFADKDEATITEVKSAAIDGKIKLVQWHTTRTRAKNCILHTILCTNEEAAEKKARFDNLKKRTGRWHSLVQYYGHCGIVAMIPAGQTEIPE